MPPFSGGEQENSYNSDEADSDITKWVVLTGESGMKVSLPSNNVPDNLPEGVSGVRYDIPTAILNQAQGVGSTMVASYTLDPNHLHMTIQPRQP